MSAPVPGGTRFTRQAMLGMCLSFVVIGALQALYGPAIPAMRARFDLSPGQVGLALSVHFVGALLGVLGTPQLRRRVTNRAFLVLALGTMTAGCLGFAAAPAWPVALTAAFVAGIGFGWIDVGVNELFIEFYGADSTGKLNLLHGNFGVGAVLGPLLVGALPTSHYSWAFVVCAALSLTVLLTVRGVSGRAPAGVPAGHGRSAAVWRLASLFSIFFILHVGVEAGAGGWETSHLVHLGWGVGPAAMATSGFWLAMTAIRFAVSPIARRFTAQRILMAGIVVMLSGTLIACWPPLAPIGYVIAGIGVGPLFPTGLVWLSQRLPGVRGVTSYVIAASMLGGVLPSLIGLSVEQWGLGAVPVVLSVIGGCCLLAALVIRMGRPVLGPEREALVPDSVN
jgi:fucose permease